MMLFRIRFVAAICAAICFVLPAKRLEAQVYAGVNLGPLLGRTLDVHTFVHPKNEDWLAMNFGGGYTLNTPLLFPKKDDCVSGLMTSGYHLRLGARNTLTDDHHRSAVFWGLNLVFSGFRQQGDVSACDPDKNFVSDNQAMMLGGAVNAGYTWNIFNKYLQPKLLLDFGLQCGFPMWSNQPIVGARNYLPGLGFGKTGNKGVNFELIVIARYELWHGRYGYKRTGKRVSK